MRRVTLFLVAAMLGAARADVVHLKGGGKIEGHVVVETSTTVVVDAGDGKVSIDRSEVESIERSPPPAAAGTSVRSGPHFRVTCHFENDACADEALAAAEDAWPLTLAVLGVAPAPLDHPLDIHLYRNPAEFAAADAKFAGGRLAKDFEGFADDVTHTAHVLVRPDYGDAVWRRVGAPRDFLATVGHEAAHLAIGVRLASGARQPPWFAEGLAQHVEGRILLARKWSAGLGSVPRWSGRMSACLRLRREGLLPEPRAILGNRLDHLDVNDRYAVVWAFFELLLRPDQRGRSDQLFGGMLGMAAGDDPVRRLSEIAERTWGAKGLDVLNDAFRTLVDTFSPTWRQSGELDVAGEQWTQWNTDPTSAAYAWRVAGVGRTDFRIAGSFELVAGGRRASVDLGRSDAGFVAVFFDATDGVWICEYDAAKKDWNSVECDHLGQPIVGEKTGFEIHVVGDAIHVTVAGKDALDVSLHGRDLSGAWGVGVNPGTTAIWTGVTVK